MLKNKYFRYILEALLIAVSGFILLNILFMLDYIFSNFLGLFISDEIKNTAGWFQPFTQILFAILICIASFYILRSKLKTIFKATFLMVPTALILVLFGILFYRWPVLAFSVGGLVCIVELYYLDRTKQPWQYYFTVIFIGLTLAIFTLAGGEI